MAHTSLMATDGPAPAEVPGLPPEVLTRLVTELGRRGTKAVDCLRTASALISQGGGEGSGLRFAESAAYNLREAFDAVVAARPPSEGGVRAAVAAWRRYQMVISEPAADGEAARAELDGVLERLEQDEERQAFRTLKLLEYIRDQTGVEPLPGEGDPTVRYSRLLERANSTLHEEGTLSDVTALYDEAVAWFIRFFTPPDERVRAVAALAESPYADGSVDELRELVLNAHHLGLFFSRLQDAAWLDPLHDAGLIALPRDGEPWPVSFLIGGVGGIDPGRVAAVLDRLLGDSRHKPEPERLGIARHILQDASRLGSPGHEVAGKIITRFPSDRWVRMIAVSMATDADSTDPFQVTVADALLGNGPDSDDAHHARRILARLTDGLTTDNVAVRVGLVAAKIGRLAAGERMRFVVLDIAALHTDGHDDLREPVLILAQHLAAMIPVARDLGLSTADLLNAGRKIPGELGERLVCQVLAGAEDVDRDVKIGHIDRRMASERATGDDRDLIRDILTTPLSADELSRWQTAFGEPSPAPATDGGPKGIGDNWVRAWRWSLVLPNELLGHWKEAIAAVTAQHGMPMASSLDTRIPRFMWDTGGSPHSSDEFSDLPVLDAAALVSSWRPSEHDDWGVSARELARALEAVVVENPRGWTEDPAAVVATLREPVHVEHYFRAISKRASDLADRASAVIAAAELVRAEQWEPAVIGRDNYDYEPDWSAVDTVTVDMIAAFANTNGDLAADLDTCWARASESVRRLPHEMPRVEVYKDTSEFDDPLNRAINRPYGKALEAVLALAGWEHRNQGGISSRLVEILDEVLAVPGAVGLELRSVLASRRPLLETVTPDWLNAQAGALFGPGPLGTIMFGQTLKYSRPTRWFFGRFTSELMAAARRGADHAVSWLLIAFLWDEPDFTFPSLARGLRGHVPALKAAAEEMASLMQGIEPGDPMVDRGLQFWADLLAADRGAVPAEALIGAGRWTFVKAIDEERWFELMDRTLGLTEGEIDMAIEIADRCKAAQPSNRGLRMLRMMVGNGEPWEQHYIETTGVEALRLAAKHPVGEEFNLLRSRLIERGRHEAADITP